MHLLMQATKEIGLEVNTCEHNERINSARKLCNNYVLYNESFYKVSAFKTHVLEQH